MRLLDFNPVGGTTSPLLFSWEQLGYAVPLATAEKNQPADPEGSGAEATVGTAAGPAAANGSALEDTTQNGMRLHQAVCTAQSAFDQIHVFDWVSSESGMEGKIGRCCVKSLDRLSCCRC